MTKNIKRIVIAAGSIVVIVLALVIMKYVFPEEVVQEVDTTAAATDSPVYYLIHRSGNDVRHFRFNYADGTTFELDIEETEDGQYRYTANPEDDFFGYNTSRFRSMMYTVSSLNATSLIETDPVDLSIYGLDEPQFSMVVTYADGDDVILYVGDETPVKNYYYANTNEDDTVYTIGSYITSLITRKPYEYRSIDTFPTYEDDEIYENITRLCMTRRDGVTVDIVMDTDLNMEGNITSSTYMMTAPFLSPCNGEVVESMLDVVATISYDSIVNDITRDQLAEYGMDKPARLCLEDTLGNSIDLVVGTIFNGGSCYAVIGRQYDAFMAGELEYLTILYWTEDNFDWVDVDYMDIQIRTPWIINIHDVESVTYDFNGTVYEMVLYEYDDVTGSGVDVVRTCSYINGKDIGETNTKRIYGRTLNFRQVNPLSPDTVYEADYSYSITVKMQDGTSRCMTFHKINERQYACVLDGVAEYYIYASNLTNLTTALERAMDDREVPMVYNT